MKIAYICADPGIPVLGNKGASVHVREITGALVSLGHRVHIYAAAGGREAEPKGEANTPRAPFTVLAPSDRVKRNARLLAGRLSLANGSNHHAHLESEMVHLLADSEFIQAALPDLRHLDPDVIVARHAFFSAAGPALARELGCPCILEVNAPVVEERRRYWDLALADEAEAVEQEAFSRSDLMVAVSQGVRSYLLRCGVPSEKALVLPNGVNLGRFHPQVDGQAVRGRYRLDGSLVIGFAGSLKPWHGVDSLIRAFTDIRQEFRAKARIAPRLRMLIVGDGPQRGPLTELCHGLALQEVVVFTGAVSYDEMPAHLAAMDIAVAPYRSSQGFYFSPLKIMEYLAMGKPVVAPPLGQIPSLLKSGSEACGLVYAPTDRAGLRSALLTLIQDTELRRELGARGAAHARAHLSWEVIARHLMDTAGAMIRHVGSGPIEAVRS